MESQRLKTLERFKELFPLLIDKPLDWYLFKKYYELGIRDAQKDLEDDWKDISERPKEYGKYFVHRKDGKVHWETWNRSGWAYNGNVITHWKEVKLPNIKIT